MNKFLGFGRYVKHVSWGHSFTKPKQTQIVNYEQKSQKISISLKVPTIRLFQNLPYNIFLLLKTFICFFECLSGVLTTHK